MALKRYLFTSMSLVMLVVSTEQNFLPPLDAALLAPPPTKILQARGKSTSSTIDVNSLPDCAALFCSPSDWQGSGLCPSVPCPSSTDTSCTTVTTECFCKLKYPINCGWTFCTWSAWYHSENWYAAICPDAKPVNFSGLPKCVRECLPRQFISYGCITLGASCVCNADELFGCASKCDAQSNTTIATWYDNLCGVKEYALGDSAAKAAHSGVVPIARPRTPISWYETYAIVVACASVLALIVVVVTLKILDNNHRYQKLKPKGS